MRGYTLLRNVRSERAGLAVAVYRFQAKLIKRSDGRSSTAAAAYRAAAAIEDTRTGLVHDYGRKAGVLHTEIMAPDHAPVWMSDRAQLWNAVEAAEKRGDAQLSRELLLSLPSELNDAQRRELVRAFVADEFVARGMVADLAIHAPHRDGDDRNHHAHVMLTMRVLTGEGFGNKDRSWNDKAMLEHWRETWAQYQNRALERAGRRERVDHRSLEAQGIDREPEPKQGPIATTMERQGRESHAGDDRRATQTRNAERDRLRRRREAIDRNLRRSSPSAFEQWANQQRAFLQSRRIDAETRLSRSHQRALDAQEARLAAFYGERLSGSRKELEAIQGRQNAKRGRVSRLVYQMTGAAGRDRDRAAALQAGIADSERRQAEQREGLATRQQEDRATLQADSARKSAALEIEIGRSRMTGDWQSYRRAAANEAREEPSPPQAAQEQDNMPGLSRVWTDAERQAIAEAQARRDAERSIQDFGRERDGP